MTAKFRFDNKALEVQNTYSIKEQGYLYLLAFKDRELTTDDSCVISIIDRFGDKQERQLLKNVEGVGAGSQFPSGAFFIYQTSTTEMEEIGEGHFAVYIRIYNDVTGDNRIVMKESLRII